MHTDTSNPVTNPSDRKYYYYDRKELCHVSQTTTIEKVESNKQHIRLFYENYNYDNNYNL